LAQTRRITGKLSIPQRFSAAINVFKASGTWQPQSIKDLDRWMDATQFGASASAMNFTAYFSGVMQIAQAIASVSLPLYKTVAGKRVLRPEHPTYKMLNGMANPWVNSTKWREFCMVEMLNYGDSYSWISIDSAYRAQHVYPLDSQRMEIKLLDSGEPVYIYTKKDGTRYPFPYDEIFHLSGFGPDAYTGYSLISLFRAAIELGGTLESFSNNFIQNGVHSSGVLTHPENIGGVAYDRLKQSISVSKSGSSNAGKAWILEEGMTWTPMSMALKDAEFLGSRTFQIQEMARILNMPIHKLKDPTGTKYASNTEGQVEWYTDTLRPHFERFEKAIDTQLILKSEQKFFHAEHMVKQLMRGDAKSTAEATRINRFSGLINTDEGREEIGREPMDDPKIGGRYWQPSNMMDASSEAAEKGGGDAGGTGRESEEQMVQDPGEE
jgi:HK97 family phage portal protein